MAEDVRGDSATESAKGLYAMLNDEVGRAALLHGACERYGYRPEQVEMRLYAGHFAGEIKRDHERRVRQWCADHVVGGGPIQVFGIREVARAARRVASSKTYRDNPALVAIRVMEAAGMLVPTAL